MGKIFFCILLLLPCVVWCRPVKTTSPDGRLSMVVRLDKGITYEVLFDGKPVVAPSAIDLLLGHKKLSDQVAEVKSDADKVCSVIEPLYGKMKRLPEEYNRTTIRFKDNSALEVRAYNEGVAYRFVTSEPDSILVKDEVVNFNPVQNPAVIYPQTDAYTSWELMYLQYASVFAIGEGQMSITPIMCSRADGIKVVLAESDVRSYPGMYVVKNGTGFRGQFAHYPDSLALGSWGNFISVVQRRRDYIAHTKGERTFPWRVVIVTDDDRTLPVNQLVYKLAAKSEVDDTKWIKPGKATWEWWHEARLDGVDFPSGPGKLSTQLYKYYIDFAAENGLEYLLIDAGWSHIFDLGRLRPAIDIPAIVRYGNEKQVGTFLWCTATALVDSTVDKHMKMMQDWGVAGIKVDFFDRDDQLAMDWYEMIARKAAQYHLMVDFHGCSKPTGLQRTFPNILSFEAVRGSECVKWDHSASPGYHTLLPFIRMLGGPMDTTPGSLSNGSQFSFKPIPEGHPMTMGTRCNELAMMVVYDQYFLTLSDSPVAYRKEPEMLKLISDIPVDFDTTVVLGASVGEYVLMAKQKGDKWYVGGITNWTARDLTIDFSFLPEGVEYEASVYRDVISSYYHAEHYKHDTKIVSSKSKMDVQLMAGGGVVMVLTVK